MTTSKILATPSSLLSAVLYILTFSATVLSQSTTGTVSGTVKDAAVAAVSVAEVSLTHSQALLRTAITGVDGQFVLNSVGPGSYELKVSRAGFSSYRTVLQVTALTTKELSIVLEVNSLA